MVWWQEQGGGVAGAGRWGGRSSVVGWQLQGGGVAVAGRRGGRSRMAGPGADCYVCPAAVCGCGSSSVVVVVAVAVQAVCCCGLPTLTACMLGGSSSGVAHVV